MTSIVFLDVDGVLNNDGTFARAKFLFAGKPISGDELDANFIDPMNVVRLKALLDLTGARVVVSSSWRSRGLDRMRELLASKGIDPSLVVGLTPELPGRLRGHEIDAWLRENPGHDRFVILDDDADMAPHEDRLVRTDHGVGLTRSDAALAYRILKGAV